LRILKEYQWKSRQLQLLFFTTIFIWALFAIIFAFTDLQISRTLVDYNSPWARVVASYGEVPGHFLISISLTLILRDLWIHSKWLLNPIFWITFFFNLIVILLLLSDLVPEPLLHGSGEIILVLGYLIGQFLIIQLLRNLEYLSQREKMNFARITFYLALITPLIFVQSFKILWGRVRFRDLAANYTNFTPWFLPQGITGNYSFPSGHTAMGWMLLPILVFLTDKNSWPHRIIGVTILTLGMIVALGRIVIGAHYASDVVFSTGAAFISFILLYNHYECKTIDNEL
jgi:membrane-associated phospholipid phosphatase